MLAVLSVLAGLCSPAAGQWGGGPGIGYPAPRQPLANGPGRVRNGQQPANVPSNSAPSGDRADLARRKLASALAAGVNTTVLIGITPARFDAAFAYRRDPEFSAKLRAQLIGRMATAAPAMRETLEKVLANDTVAQEFERLVAAHGYSSFNVADAIAAELWTSWQHFHGVSLTDAQIRGIHQQVRAAVLGIPELQLQPAGRQMFAESLAYTVVFRELTQRAGVSHRDSAQLRQETASLTGVDIAEMEVTPESGFRKKQAAPAGVATPAVAVNTPVRPAADPPAQSSQPPAGLAAKGGAGQQWQPLNAKVLEALKAGNFTEDTTKLAQEALSVARKTFGDRSAQAMVSLANLASLYKYQGRYDEAEPLFKEVLQVERAMAGPRNASTLTTLSNLANLYSAQGRYGEAEPLFREALQARRAVLGAHHPDTLGSLNNLASLYHKQGRNGEAESLYRDALQASREALGARHLTTLTEISNLASLYQDEGRYGEAEPLSREAVQARREVLGARHPDTLGSLNNLAVLYKAQGRYREAEPLFKEVLQTEREVRGSRHPDTLTALNNLASLYEDQGRYGEAEPLFREAVETKRTALGDRHPDTLASEINLASLYFEQGRYEEAEPLLKGALQTEREVQGPRHPATLTALNNLAYFYKDQSRYSEAEPLFLEALEAQREVLGARHPSTLMSLNNLASLYQDQGRHGDAEPLLREALQARREVLGARHPATLTSLNDLAVLYNDQGRYGEAEPLFRELLQAGREALGPRHPETLKYRLNRVTNLASQDKRAEAVRLLQQMEGDLLGWIGQELYSTEAGATRRHVVSSHANFQDAVLTLATAADASSDARRLAGTTMFRFKALQGEEEAYLARLARRSQDPRVQALVNDIGRLRATLAVAAQGAPDAFEKTLQALEGKQRELVAISPAYNERLRVLAAGLDEVRKALPEGSALIEFRQFRPVDFRAGKRGKPRFAALLLTGDREPVVADLGPVSELQPLAAALGGSASGRGPAQGQSLVVALGAWVGRGLAPDPQGQPLTPADEAAAQLYERLIAPFKDAVAAAKTVYIAPDGILNLTPFARLKLNDGRYWFEQQEVRLLQTGRDLLRPGVDHPGRGLLALGGIDFDAGAADKVAGAAGTGPHDSVFFAAAGSDQTAAVGRTADAFRLGFPQLPATASEVKEVMASYKKRYADEPAEIWSGADATKARLMALRTPPRVLHLATHGFYLPNRSREPMLLSGIALAGANGQVNGQVNGTGNDGLLFALEAEGLNLDGTELVVLSACDTAKGDVDYSEGVFGLARALRTAGARNVLVTLWPLDDLLARDFMADFYKNWTGQSDSDPAKALRDTQLQWIRQDARRNPRAWAPYVLIE